MMGLAEREAKCRQLVRKYYSDLPTRDESIDETLRPLLRSSHALLDAGSGDTLVSLNRYATSVAFAVGIDMVTPSKKPAPNAAVTIGDLGSLPFEDRAFDLIVSRSVVEHLEHPRAVFGEMARVLKPGGYVVFTTPNKYYYSSIVAGLIPFSWKDRYMKWMFGEDSYDHFPVFYRANTRRALRAVAERAGLAVERIEALRHFPYYLLFSPALFRVGMLYDWIITRFRLDGLQSTWLVVLRRPG
jgi:SAM-dependent methyltransferase